MSPIREYLSSEPRVASLLGTWTCALGARGSPGNLPGFGAPAYVPWVVACSLTAALTAVFQV